VVLATDARYPDALASAYLESSLGTGELLTPATSLSAATANAIRVEGITQVYIVGGPLAVSTAVSQRLESLLAYNCGGSVPLTSDGPVRIEVTRIAGATEYDTARWVAEYPPAGAVGSLGVAEAYAGTNRTGGTGKYNDTSGDGSATPATSSALPTAIVATGRSFQDAEAASILSYADHLPILLTNASSLSPQVEVAIGALAIKQVIVMGGPLAVADDVVSSLESRGISVLRVAGRNATDTAVQLADFEMASKTGHLGAGWTGSGGITVARGDYFTDGLAGAVVAAGAGRTHTHDPEPLLLCNDPTTVGQYLSAFLAEAGRTGIDDEVADRVVSLTILGGPQAVSPSVVTAMIGDL
ncbi:MAG: cell wall-binding repeat-containing protein, partial [Acidimicrobiales bacterium]